MPSINCFVIKLITGQEKSQFQFKFDLTGYRVQLRSNETSD